MVDTAISGLTADTAPSSDDLVVTVNDPGGTPANRKVTIANLLKQLPGNLSLTDATTDYGLTLPFTNDNAGTINKGAPVYLKSNGNIDLADADAAGTTDTTIGLVADATIATTASGAICLFGVVDGFDTSLLTAGALVYVATGAAGGLTTTQPTGSGAQIRPVGYCLESNATTGRVLVIPSGWSAVPTADGAAIYDENGNEILVFDLVVAAENHIAVRNAADQNAPAIMAIGDDTDVGLDLIPKGAGAIECSNGHRNSIYIPASAMISRTTAGAAANSTELATNDVMIETMDFATGADEHVQFSFPMPKNWNASTVTFQFYWSHPTTTVDFGVAFGLQAVAFANDDALDTAFGTAVLVTDDGGTTDDLYVSAESAAITIAGTPVAEEMVYFQLYRDVSDAGDDLAVDARIHGVRVFYDVIALTED